MANLHQLMTRGTYDCWGPHWGNLSATTESLRVLRGAALQGIRRGRTLRPKQFQGLLPKAWHSRAGGGWWWRWCGCCLVVA